MRHWIRGAAALAAVLFIAYAEAASAQDYPPGGAQLTVQDATRDGAFNPGESGSASATNLTANQGYLLDFEQGSAQPVGEGRTDAAGAVTFTFTIPSNSSTASASLVARPSTGTGRQASAAIQIVAAGTSAAPTGPGSGVPQPGVTTQATPDPQRTGGGLPRSGIAIAAYVGLALVLIALGATLIALARRRRTKTAS